MASRPVFVPTTTGSPLVKEESIEFEWHPGMAPSQKQKNVQALHEAARAKDLGPTLEVSSKSLTALGAALSAFNLVLDTDDYGRVTVEAAFQGSKVFQDGGPHPDMFRATGSEIKGDPRLTTLGKLVRFEWEGVEYPLEPRTAFYDWLYLQALRPLDDARSELMEFQSFSDIEFNPKKSANCQARTCALYVSLTHRSISLGDVASFDELVAANPDAQSTLFP